MWESTRVPVTTALRSSVAVALLILCSSLSVSSLSSSLSSSGSEEGSDCFVKWVHGYRLASGRPQKILHSVSLEICKQECASTPGCAAFAFGTAKNSSSSTQSSICELAINSRMRSSSSRGSQQGTPSARNIFGSSSPSSSTRFFNFNSRDGRSITTTQSSAADQNGTTTTTTATSSATAGSSSPTITIQDLDRSPTYDVYIENPNANDPCFKRDALYESSNYPISGNQIGFGRDHFQNHQNGVPIDCFYRLMSGKRLVKTHTLRAISVNSLQECQEACISERSFNCRSISYRYMPSTGYSYPVSNCEMSSYYMQSGTISSSYSKLDFVEDYDYDYFQRETHCKTTSSTTLGVCAVVVRRGGRVSTTLIKSSHHTVTSSQCEHLCATSLFRCRAFSFRHTTRGRDPYAASQNRYPSSSPFTPTPTRDLPPPSDHTCLLYDTDLMRLPSYNIEPDQDFDLFEMGRLMGAECLLYEQFLNRRPGYYSPGPVTSTVSSYPPENREYYPAGGMVSGGGGIYHPGHHQQHGMGSSTSSRERDQHPHGTGHNYLINRENDRGQHHHQQSMFERDRGIYGSSSSGGGGDRTSQSSYIGDRGSSQSSHYGDRGSSQSSNYGDRGSSQSYGDRGTQASSSYGDRGSSSYGSHQGSSYGGGGGSGLMGQQQNHHHDHHHHQAPPSTLETGLMIGGDRGHFSGDHRGAAASEFDRPANREDNRNGPRPLDSNHYVSSNNSSSSSSSNSGGGNTVSSSGGSTSSATATGGQGISHSEPPFYDRKRESCLRVFRQDAYLLPEVSRATFPVKTVDECRVECVRSLEVLRFPCRAMAYRHTSHSSIDRANGGTCQLSDNEPREVDLVQSRDRYDGAVTFLFDEREHGCGRGGAAGGGLYGGGAYGGSGGGAYDRGRDRYYDDMRGRDRYSGSGYVDYYNQNRNSYNPSYHQSSYDRDRYHSYDRDRQSASTSSSYYPPANYDYNRDYYNNNNNNNRDYGNRGSAHYNQHYYEYHNKRYGDNYGDRNRYYGSATNNHYSEYPNGQGATTVNGERCLRGCRNNRDAGFYYCQIDEQGAWDFCCRPDHFCGYSKGLSVPWCYVGTGPSQNIWRSCEAKGSRNNPFFSTQPNVAYLHDRLPPTVYSLTNTQVANLTKDNAIRLFTNGTIAGGSPIEEMGNSGEKNFFSNENSNNKFVAKPVEGSQEVIVRVSNSTVIPDKKQDSKSKGKS